MALSGHCVRAEHVKAAMQPAATCLQQASARTCTACLRWRALMVMQTVLDFMTRYPLMGGWKVDFKIGKR